MRTSDFVRTTKIMRVVQESSNIRSFFFKDTDSLRAFPGQFAMVWLPGAGEFPMSLSLPSANGLACITVKSMGAGSDRLYRANIGEYIGIRGPYGNYFDIATWKMRRVLLVGGGTGMVPIIVLARALTNKRDVKPSLVVGARTRAEIPFLSQSKNYFGPTNVFPATDDGSFGFHGLAHEKVNELLRSEKFDMVFSCGPEKMMSAVYESARKKKVPVQFSLERIMKCGIGICGSCCVGDYVLCKDGPVFSGKELDRVKGEFGFAAWDKTGTLVKK